MIRLLAAAFLALVIIPVPALATEPLPGDACSPGNAFVRSGGPEAAGKVYFMTCQGGVWKQIMTTDTNGSVGIGTTSPTAGLHVATAGAASKSGERLDGAWYAAGTATTNKPQLLIEPAGATSTAWSTSGTGLGVNAASAFTGNLIDAQLNGGGSLFKVDYQGNVVMAPTLGITDTVTIGNTTNCTTLKVGTSTFAASGSCTATSFYTTGSSLQIAVAPDGGNGGGTGGTIRYDGLSLAFNATFTHIGNENAAFNIINPTFAPTSGNGIFDTIRLAPIINQTSTASGVSRGVYINPAITSAADFRAFEASTYTYNLLGAPPATVEEALWNAPTLAAASAKTVTNAATQVITGAPIAGTNVTITNPYALWIQGGNTRFDGNVGVATTTPAAKLDVNGEIKIGNTGLACSGATTGALRYSGGIQYCNGTSWTNATSACAVAASPFSFTNQTGLATSTLVTSNIIAINGTDPSCNSNVSVTGNGSPQFRVCSDAACASVVQNWTATTIAIAMNGRYLQIEATTPAAASSTYTITASVGGTTSAWTISTNATGPCGNVGPGQEGAVCSDGSIYAGVSPDTNVNMYVMPCDLGQSVSGGSCTGTRSYYTWNNGTLNWTNTGYISTVTGKSNTANLLTINDAGSPYAAAVACNGQTFGSHSDWYLPARDELNMIWTKLSGGAATNGFSGSAYWTSTEYLNAYAWNQRFSDGSLAPTYKNNSYYVRCVRR